MDPFQQLKADGFAVIENFLSDEEIEKMMKECHDIVDSMNPLEHNNTFSTTKQDYRNNYFINSGDRISFFFEEKAKAGNGELRMAKYNSLNKIGHALHKYCKSFSELTFSDKVKKVVKQVGFVDPVVCQSMYIFKPPGIGGAVTPHQDGTFLHTLNGRHPLLGLWLALEDADVENSCLAFAPGSHKDGLLGGYRMIRNPDEEAAATCIFEGQKPEYNFNFTYVPVKKGSLVLIDGLVVHKSEENLSNRSRHIYTFHVYDQSCCQWDSRNWLQPTEKNTFQRLF